MSFKGNDSGDGVWVFGWARLCDYGTSFAVAPLCLHVVFPFVASSVFLLTKAVPGRNVGAQHKVRPPPCSQSPSQSLMFLTCYCFADVKFAGVFAESSTVDVVERWAKGGAEMLCHRR